MTEPLMKEEFLKEVAKRAGFTEQDTKIFWSAVEMVFTEAVLLRQPIQIGGFGALKFFTIAERVGTNPKTKKRIHYPATTQIRFVVSHVLRDSIKPLKKRRVTRKRYYFDKDKE